MPWGYILFILLMSSQLCFAATGSSCGKATPEDSSASINNWLIHSDIDSLAHSFSQAYDNKFRLSKRAYQAQDQFLLPSSMGLLDVPESFINTLSRHMTLALENGYADYIVYPDMGHVHILVPDDVTMGKDLLSRNDLLFLYHTGELLEYKEGSPFTGKLKDDPWLLWRYFSRNLVGDTKVESGLSVLYAKGASFNTVRSIDDYKQVMTMYFSSNKKGCFSYETKNKQLNYDISLRK